MNKAQQAKFDLLYQRHVNALGRQGKAETTIDAYSRALRRITELFDLCPDKPSASASLLPLPDQNSLLGHRQSGP